MYKLSHFKSHQLGSERSEHELINMIMPTFEGDFPPPQVLSFADCGSRPQEVAFALAISRAYHDIGLPAFPVSPVLVRDDIADSGKFGIAEGHYRNTMSYGIGRNDKTFLQGATEKTWSTMDYKYIANKLRELSHRFGIHPTRLAKDLARKIILSTLAQDCAQPRYETKGAQLLPLKRFDRLVLTTTPNLTNPLIDTIWEGLEQNLDAMVCDPRVKRRVARTVHYINEIDFEPYCQFPQDLLMEYFYPMRKEFVKLKFGESSPLINKSFVDELGKRILTDFNKRRERLMKLVTSAGFDLEKYRIGTTDIGMNNENAKDSEA